jgi:predicted GH43/DUF377 family glycosyl hydrolase/tetratricopeptide (TPR) repeat protein
MGQRFALIIGNSIYNDVALARLLTPDADIGALADILLDPEYGDYDDVKVLANMSAQTVRRSISSFFSNRGREALLLLYFSGHGILDDQGQLYLAVKDTDSKLLRATAIPARFITEEMNNSRSQRQVLVLDCCHSGAFARGSKGQVGASVGTGTVFEGTGYGHVVLTASDATQYAWEGDQIIGSAENSLFTYYMIQGINSGKADADSDGQITVDELYDYIYEQVIRHTSKQTPGKWSYKEQGEIVIANSPRTVLPVQPVDDLFKPDQDELEQKLEDLYTRGLSAFWLEEWDKSAQIFQSILEIRPEYPDAVTKLEAAQRNARLAGLYTRADAALQVGDWKSALPALESLVREAPNYKDAAEKREKALRIQQLSELYTQAEQLFEAKQWQAVINVFYQINAIEPEYEDANNLLSIASQEADKLKRQQETEALYRKAILKMDALQWQEARQLFLQVLAQQSDYRQASRLLEKAEKELNRLQQERQRQEQVAALYVQARDLMRNGQWAQALGNIEEIRRLDATFSDSDGVAEKARQAISRQQAEMQKQERLAERYNDAVNLLKLKQYQAALEKWAEIQAIDPRYPDRQQVQTTARKKLNELSKPAAFNPRAFFSRRLIFNRRLVLGRRLLAWSIPTLALLGVTMLILIGNRLGWWKGVENMLPFNPAVPVGKVSNEVALTWDKNEVLKPAVISVGARYWMWYDGTDPSGIIRIGLAYSYDGISWEKYTGNPLLSGTQAAWDQSGEHAPFVLHEDGMFKMWYEGSDGRVRQLGYATSPDGIVWTKYADNPVLRTGAGGTLYDLKIAGHGTILHEADVYKLWYHAQGDDGPPLIAYASSADGIHWTKHGPVLQPEPGQWDDSGLWGPCVLRIGSTYWMWYAGYSSEDYAAIGVATSENGINWRRITDHPVIREDQYKNIGDPQVLYEGNSYKMWYNTFDPGVILYAKSGNGIDWIKSGVNPVLLPSTP